VPGEGQGGAMKRDETLNLSLRGQKKHRHGEKDKRKTGGSTRREPKTRY